MKVRVKVRVPVERGGLFGHRKIVYEERTILVDKQTYRRIQREQQDAEFEDFLDDMEIMDAILGG